MIRTAACLTLALTLPAGATEICARLDKGDASLGDPGATCRSVILPGGATQESCHWSFGYRDPAAAARLAALKAAIETCIGPAAALPEDLRVNHPDSFALHVYEGRGMRVALSLKDKARQGRSLVFLGLNRLD